MSDIEELMKLLEEEEEKKDNLPPRNIKEQRVNKDVIRFIRKTGLAPGENKVPTYLVYYHFIKWGKRYWIAWKKEEFFRTFKQFFQQKRSGHQRYYLINNALDLSEEAYEKAQKYDQKWQKRKNSKKRKSIPRPKQRS